MVLGRFAGRIGSAAVTGVLKPEQQTLNPEHLEAASRGIHLAVHISEPGVT